MENIENLTEEKLNAIAIFMDDEKREQVHFELAPCTPKEFLVRYLEIDPAMKAVLREEFGIVE